MTADPKESVQTSSHISDVAGPELSGAERPGAGRKPDTPTYARQAGLAYRVDGIFLRSIVLTFPKLPFPMARRI